MELAAVGLARTDSARAELISYANAGGRSLTVVQRQRQYEQSASLQLEDVPVGSRVALKRGSTIDANGYRTPFYVGEVLSHTKALYCLDAYTA